MEKWKDIKGYEGLYQVSDLGRIKSLHNGRHNIYRNKILVSQKHNSGYLSVGLTKKGVTKTLLIHRLVAVHFIPNPENKTEVNHKLGIKYDNRATELEWLTRNENQEHKYKILGHKNNFQTNHYNLGKIGKYNNRSKKINQYNLSGELIKTWDSMSDIYRILNFTIGCISSCCNGHRKTAHGFKWGFNN